MKINVNNIKKKSVITIDYMVFETYYYCCNFKLEIVITRTFSKFI